MFAPSIVSADSYYADVFLKENGDVTIREATVKEGSYEYLQRDLVFGYSKDNSIYSADKINLIRICESDKDNPLGNIGTCFARVNQAKEGNSLVYLEKKDSTKYSYTLYNENKSAFYMEYTLKNVFVGYDDLNEALITLVIPESKESLDNIEIKVHFLKQDDNNLAYVHGPVGINSNTKDDYITITGENFSKKDTLDLRIVTPKEEINPSKVQEGKRKSAILELEKALEEKRLAKNDLNKVKNGLNITGIIIIALLATLYVIGLGILIIKHYFSKDKKVSSDFKDEYFTSFPSEDSPAAIEYLFNHNVTFSSFKAEILYIIYKKGFIVNMLEDDFTLSVNDKNLVEPLTENEKSLRTFLVDTYGDGKTLKLYDIDKAMNKEKSLKTLSTFFNNWKVKEINSDIKLRFYEQSSSSLYTIMYCFAPFIVGLLGFIYHPLFVVMLLCLLSLPVLLYLSLSIRRTKEGNELYSRWRALRLFMEDIVTYEDKLPDKKSWGKYLAYASVFGQSKMVASNIIEKMEDSYVGVYGLDANDYLLLKDMLNNVFEVK